MMKRKLLGILLALTMLLSLMPTALAEFSAPGTGIGSYEFGGGTIPFLNDDSSTSGGSPFKPKDDTIGFDSFGDKDKDDLGDPILEKFYVYTDLETADTKPENAPDEGWLVSLTPEFTACLNAYDPKPFVAEDYTWNPGDPLPNPAPDGEYKNKPFTALYNTFDGCSELLNLDLTLWDTSNLCFAVEVFSGLDFLKTLDVSTWNTGSLTSMERMFAGLNRIKELDLSNWDTSNVTDMTGMFKDALNLKTIDLSTWDVSSVTSTRDMFNGCLYLEVLDISCFDFVSLEPESMSGMFNKAGSKCAAADTAVGIALDNDNVQWLYDNNAPKTLGIDDRYIVFQLKPDLSGIDADSIEADYDGTSYSITVTGVPDKATVVYGLTEGVYDLTASPVFTNATNEPITVYYKVSLLGADSVTDSAYVWIKKVPVSVTILNDISKEYDGSMVDNPQVDHDGTFPLYFEYKLVSEPESAYTDYRPLAVGTYNVRITAPADDNHTEAVVEDVFGIMAKEVTADNVEIHLGDKLFYDGSQQTQQVISVMVEGAEVQDYSVSGNTATESGIHQMTLTFSGSYTGSVEHYYVIYPDGHNGIYSIGNVELLFDIKEGCPDLDLLQSTNDMARLVLDADDLSDVADGFDCDITMSITDIRNTISSDRMALIEECAGDYIIGAIYDLGLSKALSDRTVPIHELDREIMVGMMLPEELVQTNPAVERTYYMVRLHGDEQTLIPCEYLSEFEAIAFESDRFSEYAIVYSDYTPDVPHTGDIDMTIWLLLLAASALVIAGAVVFDRKKQTK